MEMLGTSMSSRQRVSHEEINCATASFPYRYSSTALELEICFECFYKAILIAFVLLLEQKTQKTYFAILSLGRYSTQRCPCPAKHELEQHYL